MKIKKCIICDIEYEAKTNKSKLCSDACKAKNIYNLNRKYQSKFNKCVVYQIQCKNSNVKTIYIGSTTNLNQRKMKHRTRCNNPNDFGYNIFLYQFIRQHGGFDNFDFKVIEECENKEILKIRERYYIDKNENNLNSHMPLRNGKEWYGDNKQRAKDWYEKNKESILKRKVEYHQENKESIKEKTKERNERNKDRYTCDNCDFKTHCKTRHIKHLNTLKHKKNTV